MTVWLNPPIFSCFYLMVTLIPPLVTKLSIFLSCKAYLHGNAMGQLLAGSLETILWVGHSAYRSTGCPRDVAYCREGAPSLMAIIWGPVPARAVLKGQDFFTSGLLTNLKKNSASTGTRKKARIRNNKIARLRRAVSVFLPPALVHFLKKIFWRCFVHPPPLSPQCGRR